MMPDGAFDLPAPILAWMDAQFSVVAPPHLRLVLWGIVAAVLSMALYWLLSPQRQLIDTKHRALEARHALDRYDGDFGGAWPLIGKMLRLALRQVGLATWPALLASLPVIALIAWLSSSYGHAFPTAAMEVSVRTFPQDLPARLHATSGSPSSSHSIIVANGAGGGVSRFELSAPIATLHKRQWWNALFGNPLGYLPDDAALDRIELDLPVREYLPLGPWWLRSWHTVFFATLLIVSMAIKITCRIA